MLTLNEFKDRAVEMTNKVLIAKRDANRPWDRTKYQIYIRGLIRGYQLTKGVKLKNDTVKKLVATIMIESGVMAEVLV